MDSELEVIHHQMEGTRASLADKLDTLENKVMGTVNDATSAVAHTVEDVKSVVGSVTDTIQETVESVKETFNLSEKVRRHPWGMMGGAAAAGFFAGYLLGPSRRESESVKSSSKAAARTESSSDNTHDFPALQTLKGLALGVLMGAVREMVTEAVPESLKESVVSVLDDFTTKLGGKPVHKEEEPEPSEASESETSKSKPSLEEGAKPNGKSRKEGKEPVGPTDRGRGPLPGR